MDLTGWLLLALRVVVVFFGLLVAVMLLIWFERKLIADMQTRIGPNRAGPFGILITLADGVKLFFKEGITPAEADRPVYLIAPLISMLPAFLLYAIAALAETNRPPFDLPEAETELVAGYHTEYSGMKFAMFFLAEYLHLITVSAIAVTLFLGGWRGPAPHFLTWLWPLLWFLLKLFGMLFVYIWIRATLPRFRYDRLMNFGWKVLIPWGLFWVLFTGAVIVLPDVYGKGRFLRWSVIAVAAVFVITLLVPLLRSESRPREGAAR